MPTEGVQPAHWVQINAYQHDLPRRRRRAPPEAAMARGVSQLAKALAAAEATPQVADWAIGSRGVHTRSPMPVGRRAPQTATSIAGRSAPT
jgi:hypothetical protein